MLRCAEVTAWIRDSATGAFHLIEHPGYGTELTHQLRDVTVPGDVAQPFLGSVEEPFVLSSDGVTLVPPEH